VLARTAHPHQDAAVLVAGELLGLDKFDLEVVEVGVVQSVGMVAWAETEGKFILAL